MKIRRTVGNRASCSSKVAAIFLPMTFFIADRDAVLKDILRLLFRVALGSNEGCCRRGGFDRVFGSGTAEGVAVCHGFSLGILRSRCLCRRMFPTIFAEMMCKLFAFPAKYLA